ncbi:hypothetical protein [Lacipirellula parvula]|uniref:Neutral/alkaline non-lysosomal ceramidase N-terminal domain-containing protein n=1 Tax=Lacipirellula parvula TaxID=2650471 RepID=A0A5K7X853_9BACT|nr:hypothetical protein [Lacipirellula parvula]BBO32800.1 hypothetical protein PLANPX_2412 [Lacipirellula parvula]
MKTNLHSLAAIVVALMTCSATIGGAAELRIAHFAVDVTPPVGTPLCLGLAPRTTGVDDLLTARGVIFLPAGQAPVALVAVDWVGIANGSHERWRAAVAKACGTTPERVAVQTLHQHDAPGCDLGAEERAAEAGINGELLDHQFSLSTIESVAKAAEQALASPQPVTHLGYGRGDVERVASNRRILGSDGKVAEQRMSSAAERLRELPEGTIDPNARVVSFWNDDQPLLALTYYATHPQSYYRTGKASADFVGMARSAREAALPGVFHIHFNGASGNVAAGKYNDGTPPRRAELAERLAAGHERAWSNIQKTSLRDLEFDWKSIEVQLPLAAWLQRDELDQLLADKSSPLIDRLQAARGLSYLGRSETGRPIVLSRLRIGPVDLLHLPGEPFVEYQLVTQKLAPARFVCVAAYGDYGPGYIGLHRSYAEGGYETGRASRTAPQVETTLMGAIEELCR